MTRTPFALRATRPAQRPPRGERIGLAGVLAGLDRTGTACEVPGEAAGRGFTWEPGDAADPHWWPQGVACAGSDDVLLVSWYATRDAFGRTPGARVSVVDRSDPERPRYRHVRLVVPRVAGLRPVRVHAGGIAVVGGLLLVADTLFGVRVFRLDDVLRVGPEHVLPQWRRLRVRWYPGRRLRFSFLSAGQVEGEPSLVVGEYRRAGSSPRLVRYPLDPTTGLPTFGDDGWCVPLEAHEQQPPRMQGVAVVGSTWWVSASAGRERPGDLHVGAPGAFRRLRGVLPPGPEDLDLSPSGQRLWCATEWPGSRWVFPVELDPGA